MKILMILNKHFPPDIRVEKEAKALINAGYEVYLLSLGKKGIPESENINGINIIRTPPQSFLSKAWRFFWFSIFFDNPLWKRYLRDVIKQYEIDVVHVHDLPLVKSAISAAKKFDIPVIADLHENYPEAVKVWRKGKMSLKRKILNVAIPVWRWKRLEKAILQCVDGVITVVDEAKEHYVNDCKIPPQKVTVVMNAEDLEEFGKLNVDKSLIEKYENNFIISYIGGFGPHRGIDVAIRSMPKVLKEIPEAKLLLVGGMNSEYEMYLKKLCRNLKVENSVEFTGWVDFSLVSSYIAASDVCLVPHYASGHTNTTIPHKLFQYMAMRKPVVVSDCKPLKRIVEECKCGLVFPSENHEKMAEAVIKLYKDVDYARMMGENGRRAVEKKYNWKNEAKKLIKLYETLKRV